MVPREILKCQAVLGPTVTLVWINLTALSQLGLPLQIHSLAEQMGLDKREVSQALALLADGGWINDEGLEIQLTLAQMEPAASLERVEGAERLFTWLVEYLSARVNAPRRRRRATAALDAE